MKVNKLYYISKIIFKIVENYLFTYFVRHFQWPTASLTCRILWMFITLHSITKKRNPHKNLYIFGMFDNSTESIVYFLTYIFLMSSSHVINNDIQCIQAAYLYINKTTTVILPSSILSCLVLTRQNRSGPNEFKTHISSGK